MLTSNTNWHKSNNRTKNNKTKNTTKNTTKISILFLIATTVIQRSQKQFLKYDPLIETSDLHCLGQRNSSWQQRIYNVEIIIEPGNIRLINISICPVSIKFHSPCLNILQYALLAHDRLLNNDLYLFQACLSLGQRFGLLLKCTILNIIFVIHVIYRDSWRLRKKC